MAIATDYVGWSAAGGETQQSLSTKGNADRVIAKIQIHFFYVVKKIGVKIS